MYNRWNPHFDCGRGVEQFLYYTFANTKYLLGLYGTNRHAPFITFYADPAVLQLFP